MASSLHDHVFVYPDCSLLGSGVSTHRETSIGTALSLRPETPPSVATPASPFPPGPVSAPDPIFADPAPPAPPPGPIAGPVTTLCFSAAGLQHYCGDPVPGLVAYPVTARLYYGQFSKENTRSARDVAAENGFLITPE